MPDPDANTPEYWIEKWRGQHPEWDMDNVKDRMYIQEMAQRFANFHTVLTRPYKEDPRA